MTNDDDGASAPAAPLRVSEDLPERSFGWRRLLTFTFVAFCLVRVWMLSERVHGEQALHHEIGWLIVAALAVVFAYMTGAGLEEWSAMVTALRTKRTLLGQERAS